jgi:hypothetical protein
MDGYYVTSNLPQCFKDADEYMAKKHPKEKLIRRVREIPVPDIDSNENVNGPFAMTEEEYLRLRAEKDERNLNKRDQAEIEMIRLVAKREMLNKQLSKLDIGKKKDAKKMAAINIELKYIEEDIQIIEMKSGVDAKELLKGSKWDKFLYNAKNKAKAAAKKIKKGCKKVKKFFKKSEDSIITIAGGIIASAIAIFCKLKIG